MSINNIAFATKFATELDKLLVQKSQAAILEDKGMAAKFVGAHEVKLPVIGFAGLGDYDKDTGFAKGAVSVTQQVFTLEKDRARSFSIDREDMDETGIANLAASVMSEFVRTKVAPEVDAYTFSTIATKANGAGQTVALGEGETLAKNVYGLIANAIGKVNDATGFTGEDIVLYVNPTVYAALMATPEIHRHLRVDEFKHGEISTKVQKIDNATIIPVSDNRMKTAYNFGNDGFEVAGGAESVGIIAMPRNAAMLVKKTEKIRTFSPDVNQTTDAYKFDYRLYYDVLVKDSMKGSIFTYTY
ncbi:MAG: hypothetical protein IIW79_02690 [Clostridia bacterium]|nr:hypothetical protein [Clostridia bacterium]